MVRTSIEIRKDGERIQANVANMLRLILETLSVETTGLVKVALENQETNSVLGHLVAIISWCMYGKGTELLRYQHHNSHLQIRLYPRDSSADELSPPGLVVAYELSRFS